MMKHCNRRSFLQMGTSLAATAPLAMSASSSHIGEADSPKARGGGDSRADTPAATKTLSPLGVFLANHGQSTGWQFWNLPRWQREINDSKRMGARAIWYLPMQFGQHSRKDFEEGSPYWKVQREVCQAIVAADMEAGVFIGYNDVFPESIREHPEWKATEGKYLLEQAHVCPSIPAALDEVQRLRQKFFAEMPKLDYVVTPITDYGGCSCEKCAPLPKTYMRVLEAQSALCRRYHPQAKIVGAGHCVDNNDEDMIRSLLRTAGWVDYVAEIPRGVKPVIKYYLFPEITMVNGWGKFGPCPLLPFIKQAYQADLAYVNGAMPYSEGIHDDVNRFAVLQFARDPSRSAVSVARAYAEEWLMLRGRDASTMADVIVGLGNFIVTDRFGLDPNAGNDNPHADDRVKFLMDVRSRFRALEDSYRYWLLHYRAVCESFNTITGSLSVEKLQAEAELSRQSLVRLEPEYGHFLIHLPPYLRPGVIPWEWPRTFHDSWKRENDFSKEAVSQQRGPTQG